MKKSIACLHAHHSSIHHIEQGFANYDIGWLHFVDPGLLAQVMAENINPEEAEKKVRKQLQWMAGTEVDAILITCTNYIALMDESRLDIALPIIKIDEPYFKRICQNPEPQVVLFSNPKTVSGTMNRLATFAERHGRKIETVPLVCEDSFPLFIKGEGEKYNHKIMTFIDQLLKNEITSLSVAQLSMSNAVQDYNRKNGTAIFTPLDTLVSDVVELLQVEPNKEDKRCTLQSGL